MESNAVTHQIQSTAEKRVHTKSGWLMLAITAVLIIIAIVLAVLFFRDVIGETGRENPLFLLGFLVAMVFGIVVGCGLFMVQPNTARVLTLFGSYKGTTTDTGLRFANPFYSKKSVSLRARTLDGGHLKVNDKQGNPIEIANVTVWHVADTARAVFDVDDYEGFVASQSETALRHVASLYSYDHMESDDEDAAAKEITLRSNIAEVSEVLKAELSERLAPAGVAVDDARLTHLAYAPEIAQAMLRRQQAEAVVAAKSKIVRGAVDMVEMALSEISDKHIVDMDDERKAQMVSNLLVVLCADNEAQPVVNAGSLYQ